MVERLFEELAAARKRNIAIFAKMAAVTGAQSFGYVPRDPQAPDVTLEIMRRYVEACPKDAKRLLTKIRNNDSLVCDIVDEIIQEL